MLTSRLNRKSTWESQLRRLQIRKKLTPDYWVLVYEHLRPRLIDPRQKHLKEPTVILLHNKEIPLDKAWKEIRRSKATSRSSCQGMQVGNRDAHLLSLWLRRGPTNESLGPPRPLPPWITVHTPSHSPVPSISTALPTPPRAPTALMRSEPTTTTELSTTHTSLQIAIRHDSSAYRRALSVYEGCATTVPWALFSQVFQSKHMILFFMTKVADML